MVGAGAQRKESRGRTHSALPYACPLSVAYAWPLSVAIRETQMGARTVWVLLREDKPGVPTQFVWCRGEVGVGLRPAYDSPRPVV